MLFDHVFHGRLPIRVIYIVVQRLDQIEIICHKLMLLFWCNNSRIYFPWAEAGQFIMEICGICPQLDKLEYASYLTFDAWL